MITNIPITISTQHFEHPNRLFMFYLYTNFRDSRLMIKNSYENRKIQT